MSEAAWLVLLAVLGPGAAGVAWLAIDRREPFDPGPEGFWRAPLRRTNYGLRVEPEAVRLHARAPRFAAALALLVIGSGWVVAWRDVLRPLSGSLPAPIARLVRGRPLDWTNLAAGAFLLGWGAVRLFAARLQVDLVLEGRGDLRWHHHGAADLLDDGQLPVEAFEGVTVDGSGAVHLIATGRDPEWLFGLRGWRTKEHEADLARATDAFRALIARRAAAAG